MRPRVICHMTSTIDGMTDPRRLGPDVAAEYEPTGEELGGDAWLCGRVTMEVDFAQFQDSTPFKAESDHRAGPRETHVASDDAESFAVCADTHGKLHWKTNDIHGDHLICVVTEQASADYLLHLERKNISYIVAGKDALDFAKALEELRAKFEIATLLLEGGGHVNGAFVDAGLVDEVSLLVIPGIDGRAGVAAVFEGRAKDAKPLSLELRSADKRAGGAVWLRYDVKRD